MRFIGQAMADSGMFPDIQRDSAKAMVKILAGQEIGVTPFQAMSNINIIQGKAAMGANLMAAKVKGSGKYDYRADVSSESCKVTIRQKATSLISMKISAAIHLVHGRRPAHRPSQQRQLEKLPAEYVVCQSD
jgi:hypothetical protein